VAFTNNSFIGAFNVLITACRDGATAADLVGATAGALYGATAGELVATARGFNLSC